MASGTSVGVSPLSLEIGLTWRKLHQEKILVITLFLKLGWSLTFFKYFLWKTMRKNKREILNFFLSNILIWKDRSIKDVNTARNTETLGYPKSGIFGIPLTSQFIHVILRLILRLREPNSGRDTIFCLCLQQQDALPKRSTSVVTTGAEDPLPTL